MLSLPWSGEATDENWEEIIKLLESVLKNKNWLVRVFLSKHMDEPEDQNYESGVARFSRIVSNDETFTLFFSGGGLVGGHTFAKKMAAGRGNFKAIPMPIRLYLSMREILIQIGAFELDEAFMPRFFGYETWTISAAN